MQSTSKATQVQPANAGSAIIRLRGLTKHYHMGHSIVKALNGVDLEIGRGQFVAITGASGSGKSTMMHILGCLDRPTEGTYELNGELVSSLSDSKLAVVRNRYVGFVFQTFNLINRTSALDNVAVPLIYARQSNTRAAARAALERVGLGQRARHKSNELSGGERQRVAIARAIVNNPVLLLADEPTGNLDTATGEQIMGIFHALHRSGVTIVVVTHEPDIAAQAERIVRMRDGKVIEDQNVAAAERARHVQVPVMPEKAG
jgi:putative ABC transport system ATP-binding protein